MTEEEAKTKWCFAAIASHTNPRLGFDNAAVGDYKQFPCIGSACMAWRVRLKGQPGRFGAFVDDVGFCGLAGEP